MPVFTTALDDVLNEFGSDKGSSFSPGGHAYSFVYERLFEPFRNETFNLIEIGLNRGNEVDVQEGLKRLPSSAPSVDAWLKYFQNASVIGFDIADFSHLERDRFRFVHGDAGNQEDILRLASSAGTPQLIIDDGSHASYHQLLAFSTLFPILSPGGIYIIEDVQWQPPLYETTLPRSPRSIDVFQSYQSNGCYPPPVGRRHKLAVLLGLAKQHIPIPIESFWESAKEINYILTLTRTQLDKCIIVYKK